MKLLVPRRDILRAAPARLFIPGIVPCPKIIGAAREVNPGSQTWSTPGSYTFVVPNFNTLSVDAKGAGGGGSGAGNYAGGSYLGGAGSNGGNSQFFLEGVASVTGNGGNGGPGGSTYQTTTPMTPGANGDGVGGDTNTSGGGANAGGYGSSTTQYYTTYGGNGGRGGRAQKDFVSGGALTAGQSITITVGFGGDAGWSFTLYGAYTLPMAGQHGSVSVTWS